MMTAFTAELLISVRFTELLISSTVDLTLVGSHPVTMNFLNRL